jgi:hypothetical protein
MPFVSVTRLRVRSMRFLPFFFLNALRSQRQVKASPGFLSGALLPDRGWAFWTMTAWDCAESMRRFMSSGAHKAAMPGLLEWCDEASVVHWEQAESLRFPHGLKQTGECVRKGELPRFAIQVLNMRP